jgi:hypothetical protein
MAVRIPAVEGLERHPRDEVPTPMAKHRQQPGSEVHLPTAVAMPVATMSHPRSIDVTVCEWTTDLSAAPLLSSDTTPTSVGAARYVDFDAVDSVHESDRYEIAARP